MKTYISGGSPLSAADTTTAIENALTGVNSDDVIATRYHDTSVTNINAAAGALVEVDVDKDNRGAVLPAAVKGIEISCTFGTPVEILSGASAGAATRKLVANLGEGPTVVPLKMTSGHRVYVRSLNTDSITSGILTLNLLG